MVLALGSTATILPTLLASTHTVPRIVCLTEDAVIQSHWLRAAPRGMVSPVPGEEVALGRRADWTYGSEWTHCQHRAL